MVKEFIVNEPTGFVLSDGRVERIPYAIAEINQACNLACPGCYMIQESKRDPKRLMTTDDVGRIIDVLRPESLDILGGEPTLSPNFRDIVDVCVSSGVLPWVFTNMTVINPDMARFLKERGVYVTGKLNVGNPRDPVQRKVQAKMIGRDESFVDRMMIGLDNLLGVGYRMPMLSLENLLRRENADYAVEYTRRCLERGIRPDLELISCAVCDPKGVDEYFRIAPTREQIRRITGELEEIYQEFELDWSILPPHISGGGICRFKDNGLYFSKNNGKIQMQPCSANTTNLGSFTDYDSVVRALETPVMIARRRLKEAYEDGLIEGKCGECGYFIEKDCKGGCRATAENLSGLYGSYPLCWMVE